MGADDCADDCCSVPVRTTSPPFTCPDTGAAGTAVSWRTVAALLAGPLPEPQDFRLCRDPACDIVYFGSRGAKIRIGDLHVVPGFKHGGNLLCYCFGIRRGQLEQEARGADAARSVLERVAAAVKAGGCACEVRNPLGKCCLADLRRAILNLRRQPPA